MFNWIANKLIERAMRTPYLHIDDSQGRRYLNRYWLIPYNRTGVAVRVHHIVRSDEDRHFHDHPFTYISIVLRGGYWEVTPVLEGEPGFERTGGEAHQWRGAGSVALRRATSWHRLELQDRLPKSVQAHVGSALDAYASMLGVDPKLLIADRPEFHDCWTLFITFPAVQDWGFLVNGVKVLARDYLAGRWNDTNYNG